MVLFKYFNVNECVTSLNVSVLCEQVGDLAAVQ